MARLNISLPEDVYALAVKWRRRVNLSEICARALRSELEAAESHRSAQALFSALRSPSPLERTLALRYKLSEVVVPEMTPDTTDVRAALDRDGDDKHGQRVRVKRATAIVANIARMPAHHNRLSVTQ